MGMHARNRSSVALVAILTVVCSLIWLAGCGFVVVAIPGVVPGYGREYTILDEDNTPVQSGLVLTRSDYVRAAPMIRVFYIHGGTCKLPKETAVRFTCESAEAFPIFFCRFENPRSTYIFPLVPGDIADEDYSLLNEGRVSGPVNPTTLAEGILRVRSASAGKEVKMLKKVAGEMAEKPLDQEAGDSEARQRILRYVQQRIEKLGITDWKVPGLPTQLAPGE
jgi:hypothetical protein